jgi:hypothetical protein
MQGGHIRDNSRARHKQHVDTDMDMDMDTEMGRAEGNKVVLARFR